MSGYLIFGKCIRYTSGQPCKLQSWWLYWFQTSGQSNLTERLHGWFSGIRQVATVCTPPIICFLGPIWVHNPNGNSVGWAIFTQLSAECCRACPSLKIAASHGAICTPCNTWFLEPTQVHIPNGISICSTDIAQLMAEIHYTFQWAAPFPLKIAHSLGIWAPI